MDGFEGQRNKDGVPFSQRDEYGQKKEDREVSSRGLFSHRIFCPVSGNGLGSGTFADGTAIGSRDRCFARHRSIRSGHDPEELFGTTHLERDEAPDRRPEGVADPARAGERRQH